MICARCGTANAPGSRLCAACGNPLSGGSAVPGGDLRWASVLFVDLVDYTSLTRSWDAADIRDMLSTYFDLARTIAERYGGEVAKFIGDAVVAVWGGRLTREDDAERCIAAGLEIVAAVARFGRESGIGDLAARGGVVTGRVALLGGPQEGLVAGDIVNAASRIQSTAPPGAVFVDDITARATRQTVSYRDAGKHSLKGLGAPVRLWRVLEATGAGREPYEDDLHAVFVGRDDELAVLRRALLATQNDHRARLASVTGDIGIGKSRLVAELREDARKRAPAVVWERGRCPAYGEGAAFHALGEMIRHQLGLRGDETDAGVRARLAERLEQWLPDPDERRFVGPRLGVLVGQADRDFTRQELFAAWRLLFERLSEGVAVALVFEDLQWADDDLLDFLAHLLDWSADRPLFVVVVRRVAAGTAGEVVVGQRDAARIVLTPLDSQAIGRIVDELVSGIPEALRTQIVGQAAGVPLYAIETVRALVDRGLVAERDGRLTVVGDVDELQVPASLTALLAARLDQLPTGERELVKALSILGSSFRTDTVRAVSTSAADETDSQLKALVAKGILVPAEPEADVGGYRFGQSLLAAVAADLLSRRERKARHLAVAEHLEQAPTAPTDAELIASHYGDAHRAAGHDPDREAIQVRAADAAERAAARVSSLGLPGRSARYYEQAAHLTREPRDRLRRIEAAARMRFLSGRYAESIELYDQALDGHGAIFDEVGVARLAAPVARTLRVLGRSPEGLARLTEAVEVLARHADTVAEAEAHAALAEWYAFSLPEAEVARHADRAVELASAAGSADVWCKALNAKGWLRQRQHRTAEAAAIFRELIEVAHSADLPLAEMLGRGNLADLSAQADLPGAEAGHLAALALAERLGDVGNRAIALSNTAMHYLYAGRWDLARGYAGSAVTSTPLADLQSFGHFPLLLLAVLCGHAETARYHLEALRDWATDDDAQSRDSYLIAEAAVTGLEGDPAEAMRLAVEAARSSCENHGFTSESFRLAWPLAVQAALRVGAVDEARRLLDWIAEAPDDVVPPYLRTQSDRLSALADAASGGAGPDVEARLRSAIDGFAALGYRYWEARTRADLAALEPPDADALRAAARTTLAELGVGTHATLTA